MNNFNGFLTKKGKNIFLITLLSTALLFASCINDLFNDDKSSKKQEAQTEQSGSEELIPVKINISNKKQIENILQNVKPQKNISQARAASPQNVTLAYKILYKKVTETSPSSTVNQDNKEYMDVLTDSSPVLQLTKGNWDFTLIAYYTDADTEKVVFSGDLLKQEITPGNNTLEFTLTEPESGEGNISITLKIPALTDYETSVKAQLKTSSLAAVSDYDESELTINSTGSENSYVYSLNNVPHGNYFVVFSIKTTSKDTTLPANTETAETTVYPVPVRVVTNLTSESTETLNEIRNVCVITYDLGTDGTVTWKDSAPSRVYKKYEKVDLPKYTSLNLLQTKIFNGWKDQDGNKVTSAMTITENVTLEPDWITTTLYVDGNAPETDTEPDALTTGTAVKSLSAAVNKLVTYESLDDGDDTSYQHEWTINVNGTCYGKTYLVNADAGEPLKITKLTIAGDNNEEDILDGSVYETGTNTFAVISYDTGGYHLILENLKIQNGTLYNGGGLQITDNTVYLNNVVLKGNTATENGGGLFLSNSTAYLNNVVLIDNTATGNGGAIALTNSNLFIYGGTVIGAITSTVAASDACSNKADGLGGGIWADTDSTIYFGYTGIDSATETMTAETGTPANSITYNYAGASEANNGGGGIYCLGKLYINGGTISYNSGTYGGGVYTTNLSMKGSTVNNNAATGEGGAIYIEATPTTKSFITSVNLNGVISPTEISGNTSSSNGGGISFTDGELYISGTTICDNKATSNGGGIYVNSDTSSKLFVYGGTIIGSTKIGADEVSTPATEESNSNSAANGGGIYLGSSTQAYLNYKSDGTIDESGTVNITYNYAINDNITYCGGGIYAEMNSELYIAPGTTINYNAGAKGGGICGKESTIYMSGGTIYCNDALNGGGIYLLGADSSGDTYYGTLYMYGDAKIGTSENLIKGSYSNCAVNGGGIYIGSLSQAYLGYSGIDEENNLKPKTLTGGVYFNKASKAGVATSGYGGGIYNKGLLQVYSGSISNNISETDGGGVYNKTDAKFSMTGGTIESNTADSSGGGIFNSGTLEISVATIESNTAKYGGGVYNKGIFHVSSGNIKSNTATENGGGIYTAPDAATDETVLEDSEITKNTAKNGGGVYLSSDILYIKRATIFKENTATDKGGAISGENEYSIYIKDQEESAYAYIEPNSDCNDIYLGSSSSIFLDYNTLSPDYDYIARFTPFSYVDNEPYINEGDDDSYSKFLVTPQTVTDTTGNTTQVEWETTSEGKIQVKQP